MHLRRWFTVRALSVTLAAAALLAPVAARATTLAPLSVEDMTMLSSDVVLGTVTHVASEYSADRSQIFTYVTVGTPQWLKGEGSGEMTFVIWGGRVGDDVLRVDGSPGFTPGEQVVVFLKSLASRTPLTRPTDRWLLGLANGKWSVLLDPATRQLVARSSAPGAGGAMPLLQLTQRITAAQRAAESNVIRAEGR